MLTELFHRGQVRGTRTRADRRQAISRACFEALEGRRLMSFSPAASYAVGAMPQDVETADFDGDGRLDLAVVNWWDSTVSVLSGNGDGTFQAARTSATGAEPLSMAAGDFNNDGRMDLATANDYDVSVLLGNGDGTFGDPSSIDLGDVEEPASVAAGDFNGDGTTDLVVTANNYGPGIGYYGIADVLLSKGDGTFSAPIVNVLEWGVHSSGVVADFNGDGVQDFAAANLEGLSVSMLLGDGQGNFAQPATLLPTGADPQAVTAGDVNGDLKADLVTANRDGSASVLLGNGSGGFAAAQTYAAGSGRDAAAAVVLGDVNRDGKLDIAASGSNVSVLRGSGSGSGTFPTVESFATGAGAYGLAAGDFNGDGWLDLATADPDGAAASVLINDRSWPTPPSSVFISDAPAVTEGNTGTVNATFTLSLSRASDVDVTVQYATANLTAAAGSDYTAGSGTVTIPAGQTSATFTVAVTGDRLAEWTETFAVMISSAVNATIGDSQGIGTITDNEPRISINNVSRLEGNRNTTATFTFTVSLSAAYDQPVTVNYATAGGTATAGTDYTSKAGTLMFAPGETTKTITVVAKGDKQRESNETFFVDLFGASSVALISIARGTGTILNDDR